MISEAVATTAPVMLAPLPGRSRRRACFLRRFWHDGRVRPFTGRFGLWPAPGHRTTRRLPRPRCARRLGTLKDLRCCESRPSTPAPAATLSTRRWRIRWLPRRSPGSMPALPSRPGRALRSGRHRRGAAGAVPRPPVSPALYVHDVALVGKERAGMMARAADRSGRRPARVRADRRLRRRPDRGAHGPSAARRRSVLTLDEAAPAGRTADRSPAATWTS